MKTEALQFRLNKFEKQTLRENAESNNMSMSDYVKYCCLINPPANLNLKKGANQKEGSKNI